MVKLFKISATVVSIVIAAETLLNDAKALNNCSACSQFINNSLTNVSWLFNSEKSKVIFMGITCD